MTGFFMVENLGERFSLSGKAVRSDHLLKAMPLPFLIFMQACQCPTDTLDTSDNSLAVPRYLQGAPGMESVPISTEYHS